MFPEQTDAAIDLSVACTPHSRRLSRDSGRPGKALEIENWSFGKLLLNFLQAAKRGFHARSPEANTFPLENRLPELQFERRRGKNLEAWHILANGPNFATVARPCGSLSTRFHSRQLPL